MAKQKNYQKMHHMKKFYALIHEVLPFYVYTILDGPFGFSSYSFLPFSFSFPLIFFFFFLLFLSFSIKDCAFLCLVAKF